jgi:hypothetical protein
MRNKVKIDTSFFVDGAFSRSDRFELAYGLGDTTGLWLKSMKSIWWKHLLYQLHAFSFFSLRESEALWWSGILARLAVCPTLSLFVQHQWICLFVRSFVHSFVHSFVRSFVHSLVNCSSAKESLCWMIRMHIYVCICLFYLLSAYTLAWFVDEFHRLGGYEFHENWGSAERKVERPPKLKRQVLGEQLPRFICFLKLFSGFGIWRCNSGKYTWSWAKEMTLIHNVGNVV